ncbi:XRE family transcriptional regulator [Campylobacter helveticus]|uniref:XRE family transcriptional regulator n=1 Tax=Campylobacter helveticus TaxID=28898 RepID=UPI00214A66E6|nr:S24 family peptidase [Campylobacter helveticus]MCR2067166.1 hypothetical protein [Campylobacter helveticus]
MATKTKGEILKTLLNKHGLKQRHLADMMTKAGYKIGEDAISKYIRGDRQMCVEIMENIAKVLNEDICVFFEENNAKPKALKIEKEINCGIAPTSQNISESFIYIPNNESKSSLKALKASGNNMSPIIDEGDIIIYDSDKKTQISHGDVVVYKLYEEEACKIFIDKKDIHIIELKPTQNNEIFKTTTIRADDKYIMKQLELYKVVKIYKKLSNKQAILEFIKEY